MNRGLVEQLLATLPSSLPLMFNPWRECCDFDSEINTPDTKRLRLSHHLDCDPVLILIGEAAGYQGCRYSGIPFTSERLLLEGVIPRVPKPVGRLTNRARPFSEPSATIVWKTLYQLGIADKTILWNAIPLHPFKANSIWSNRTPSDAEIAHGVKALRLLRMTFPMAKIVAVGQKAAGILQSQAIRFEAAVRHPANGGASLFADGLTGIAQTLL